MTLYKIDKFLEQLRCHRCKDLNSFFLSLSHHFLLFHASSKAWIFILPRWFPSLIVVISLGLFADVMKSVVAPLNLERSAWCLARASSAQVYVGEVGSAIGLLDIDLAVIQVKIPEQTIWYTSRSRYFWVTRCWYRTWRLMSTNNVLCAICRGLEPKWFR